MVLSGCASAPQGPKFKPHELKKGNALIYFYRPKDDWGSIRKPDVIIDTKKFEALPEGYHPIYLSAGSHSISVRGGDLPSPAFKFKVEAGKEYFLRYTVKGNMDLVSVALMVPLQTIIPESQEDHQDLEQKGVAQKKFNPHLHFVKKEMALQELSEIRLYE